MADEEKSASQKDEQRKPSQESESKPDQKKGTEKEKSAESDKKDEQPKKQPEKPPLYKRRGFIPAVIIIAIVLESKGTEHRTSNVDPFVAPQLHPCSTPKALTLNIVAPVAPFYDFILSLLSSLSPSKRNGDASRKVGRRKGHFRPIIVDSSPTLYRERERFGHSVKMEDGLSDSPRSLTIELTGSE